ncbi:DUF960 domain-containing protein [Listeria monocytogenes]|nr:DUF960 domain-containing protein [Listeria monocytogenes]EGC7848694.1 DUF960 domain-containing protein [Listeria monocytogenes]
MWRLIDNQVKKGNEMDYLQKFELNITDAGQEIRHSQEKPRRSYKTIWVIDNVEYQTMLFPEDY